MSELVKATKRAFAITQSPTMMFKKLSQHIRVGAEVPLYNMLKDLGLDIAPEDIVSGGYSQNNENEEFVAKLFIEFVKAAIKNGYGVSVGENNSSDELPFFFTTLLEKDHGVNIIEYPSGQISMAIDEIPVPYIRIDGEKKCPDVVTIDTRGIEDEIDISHLPLDLFVLVKILKDDNEKSKIIYDDLAGGNMILPIVFVFEGNNNLEDIYDVVAIRPTRDAPNFEAPFSIFVDEENLDFVKSNIYRYASKSNTTIIGSSNYVIQELCKNIMFPIDVFGGENRVGNIVIGSGLSNLSTEIKYDVKSDQFIYRGEIIKVDKLEGWCT